MEPKAPYELAGIGHFEELARTVEINVQRLLEEHNYNTLGNFLSLYKSYKMTNCRNLTEFFQSYSPPITSEHHTCVGLALELWKRLHQLDNTFPNISDYFYLVSCEENIEVLSEYTGLNDRLDSAAYAVEKEHVLLCLKFRFGERDGLLLCDPGYHVGRVVTVMPDRAYPHTGWFIQLEEGPIRKEYNYQISALNDKFVQWDEHTIRNGKQEAFTGLIYTHRPYLTGVDVTERRNLVYNFRSLLSRDQKGHLIAGVYFKVNENCNEFTIFYQDMGKQRMKINFTSLLQPFQMKEKIHNIITICNEQLNLNEGSLLAMLRQTAELINDKDYLHQLLEINHCINVISANN